MLDIRASERRAVMMVGGGVNDAPVLAAADVGVAMGARGASAASESADIVITVDGLARSARAVHIGKRTMRVAWQAIGIGVDVGRAHARRGKGVPPRDRLCLAAGGYRPRLPSCGRCW